MNRAYYPFELHCHTLHSDGEMTPERLIKASKRRGYSGIAVTDHNTVSAVADTEAFGSEYGVKVIPGIEWTTFYGHITALGNNTAVDWREIDMHNIDGIIRRARASGATLIVAHPERYGAPMCKGCRMELPISAFDCVSGFEVWSQICPNQEASNFRAVELYDSLLRRGERLSVVYGYDWHREEDEGSFAFTFLGNKQMPLKAIDSGDTFVSAGLMLDVKIDGANLPFGSEIPEGRHNVLVNTADFFPAHCAKFGIKARQVVIKGSAVTETRAAPGEQTAADCREGYLRIEIVGDMDGKSNLVLALSSPYYITKRR